MPTAHLVCGSPGSGKSTYARHLAKEYCATLLDIDTVTERMVRVSLGESGHNPDDRDSEYFKTAFRDPIYETLFDIARENLPVQNVIIAGPFTKEIRESDWPAKLSESLGGYPVAVHFISCPPEIRKLRLVQRSNPRDLAKLQDWENYIKYYGDEKPPVFEHIFVDGTKVWKT